MYLFLLGAFLVAHTVKNLLQCRRPDSVPGWERSPREGMATHSSILAWRIPKTEEPGGLQSMGSQRVEHNWVTNTVITLFSLLSFWFNEFLHALSVHKNRYFSCMCCKCLLQVGNLLSDFIYGTFCWTEVHPKLFQCRSLSVKTFKTLYACLRIFVLNFHICLKLESCNSLDSKVS